MIVLLGPGGVSMDEHKKKWQVEFIICVYQIRKNLEEGKKKNYLYLKGTDC